MTRMPAQREPEPSPLRDVGPYHSDEHARKAFAATAYGIPGQDPQRKAFVAIMSLGHTLLSVGVVTSGYEQQILGQLSDTLTGEQMQVITGWVVRAHLCGLDKQRSQQR